MDLQTNPEKDLCKAVLVDFGKALTHTQGGCLLNVGRPSRGFYENTDV